MSTRTSPELAGAIAGAELEPGAGVAVEFILQAPCGS
jgi:hypothetical protein